MYRIKFVVPAGCKLPEVTTWAIWSAGFRRFETFDAAEAAAWEIPGAGEFEFEAEIVQA